MCDVFYLLKNTKCTIHFRDLKLQYAWYFKQVYVFENGGQSTMGNWEEIDQNMNIKNVNVIKME